MKILTLSIKQKYFDEILAGTKKVETREIRPANFKKYCRYFYDGKEFEDDTNIPSDVDVDVVSVKYDALKLLTGAYNLPKRPYLIVEVKNAEIILINDEDGNPITFEENGKEYCEADIDYHLGKIIEKRLYN
jgi:hypothetical protein